ncbi:MAG: hypothetical protein ACP5GZ_10165 [Vulcanisaeta sp.]|uniref:hypothetical protein n=1 Tax=Vulcanisaeta sp. TaxID=2020871 RepID=UPI003D14F5E2
MPVGGLVIGSEEVIRVLRDGGARGLGGLRLKYLSKSNKTTLNERRNPREVTA